MGALPKAEANRRYTYADYKNWELKEGERYELIRGRIVPMFGAATAMPRMDIRHQTVSRKIFLRLGNHLEGMPYQAFYAPLDVRLFYKEGEGDDTVVQPDIMVVCDESKIGDEGIRGAPDLAIEILSPSNTAIEMEEKRRLYQDAGVREYWVVDPENKRVTVYSFRDDGVLTETYESADTAPVGIFPGFGIALDQVFAGEGT